MIGKLSKEGIPAYIHSEARTGSVYIRFEDARIGSVRIADHPGIEKYRYKWNVRTDREFRQKEEEHGWKQDDNTWRLFCTPETRDQIIQAIKDRNTKIEKGDAPPRYGYPEKVCKSNYKAEMDRRLSELRAKVGQMTGEKNTKK